MKSKLEYYLLAGRLTEKYKKIVAGLTKSLVESKYIPMNLKDKQKDNLTNVKQMYNGRERFKKYIRVEKSEIQHLLKCLEHKYVHNCKSKYESTILDSF